MRTIIFTAFSVCTITDLWKCNICVCLCVCEKIKTCLKICFLNNKELRNCFERWALSLSFNKVAKIKPQASLLLDINKVMALTFFNFRT